jgi:hypothetical protein
MLGAMTKARRIIVSALLALAIGVGVPLLELSIKCREPVSEVCVWAKAYLPLSFSVGLAMGLVAAVVAWFVMAALERK